MKTSHLRSINITVGMFALLMATLAAPPTTAAEVRARLSSQETYVGLPVALQIQISDAEDYEPPTIPQVDGLSIQSTGAPARRSQVTIINGRRSASTTVTFVYQITPERAGSFTLPPMTLTVDGRQQKTNAMQLIASVGETSDLLFVEIAGAKDHIYVGEALELTLKIWLRPYRDKRQRIKLTERDMWRTISSQTSWGVFAERLQELTNGRQRPGGTEVLREDDDGATHSYYLYEIDATIYPQRPGRIDGNDVRIVVQYPTALGKSRGPFSSFFDDSRLPFRFPPSSLFGDDDFSPFGNRLSVTSVRPLVTEADVQPIVVKPIPLAGRPADYRGAVGQYQIVTEADPDRVSAGDPINLRIGVFGDGPMDLVPAPPLAELKELTTDFKVPDEPLAGFVDQQRKIFSTTIRPRNEDVSQIPPIPFSFFDPDSEAFVTVRSEPIAIGVSPAESLSLDAIVGQGSRPRSNPSESSATDATGLATLVNADDDRLLESDPAVAVPLNRLLAILAIPPLLVLAMQLVRFRHSAANLTSLLRSPWDRCRRLIERAEDLGVIAAAVRSLVARQLGIKGEADAEAAVGALRLAGYRDLAIRYERLFERCEYGGAALSEDRLAVLKDDALELVDELDARKRQDKRRKLANQITAARPSSVRAGLGLMILTTWQPAANAMEPIGPQLSPTQQRQLLQEASHLYAQGMTLAPDDSAEAKQAFATAAEKYQLIADSGIHNSRLYANLANAYLQIGKTGKSVANYRRSLRLDPTHRMARHGLDYVQRLTKTSVAPADTKQPWGYLWAANRWISRYFHPRSMLATMLAAWCVVWLVIGLRLWGVRFPWKSLTALALVTVAVTAVSYGVSCQQLSTRYAVVIADSVTLREGDGEQFAAVTQIDSSAGESYQLLGTRGAWVQVRTPTGQRGWLPRTAVETI